MEDSMDSYIERLFAANNYVFSLFCPHAAICSCELSWLHCSIYIYKCMHSKIAKICNLISKFLFVFDVVFAVSSKERLKIFSTAAKLLFSRLKMALAARHSLTA